MAVREATVPSTALVNEDGLLRIHISGMSLSLHAKWKYKQKSWYKKLHNILYVVVFAVYSKA